MSIDYYAVHPCKVRESVTDLQLLEMEKARNRASAVIELIRQNPATDRSIPESEWTFTMGVMGPDGPTQATLKVGELLASSQPLHELARHCRGCPANARGADFGCGGAIHYPVSARAEQWLLSRLPARLDTPRGRLLLKAISDFGYSGSAIDKARSRPELYEAKVPLTRTWGVLFSKQKVTSSQVLEMSFNVGHLQPGHARMVAYLAGFLDDGFEPVDDRSAEPSSQDDTATAEMKLFFRIVAAAATANVAVFIDA